MGTPLGAASTYHTSFPVLFGVLKRLLARCKNKVLGVIQKVERFLLHLLLGSAVVVQLLVGLSHLFGRLNCE